MAAQEQTLGLLYNCNSIKFCMHICTSDLLIHRVFLYCALLETTIARVQSNDTAVTVPDILIVDT